MMNSLEELSLGDDLSSDYSDSNSYTEKVEESNNMDMV